MEKYYRISLINSISGLKSANLIATKNENGNSNLAIFNSVIHVGSNPPLLGFLMRPLQVERHTYNNIKESRLFTINQVTESTHKKAHLTSAKFANEVSEFETCEFTEDYLDDFPIPFVSESKIKIGLSLVEEHTVKSNNTIFMVGQIELLSISDELIEADGSINYNAAEGISIGGLDTYYKVSKIGKYEYARPNRRLKKLD